MPLTTGRGTGLRTSHAVPCRADCADCAGCTLGSIKQKVQPSDAPFASFKHSYVVEMFQGQRRILACNQDGSGCVSVDLGACECSDCLAHCNTRAPRHATRHCLHHATPHHTAYTHQQYTTPRHATPCVVVCSLDCVHIPPLNVEKAAAVIVLHVARSRPVNRCRISAQTCGKEYLLQDRSCSTVSSGRYSGTYIPPSDAYALHPGGSERAVGGTRGPRIRTQVPSGFHCWAASRTTAHCIGILAMLFT